MLGETGVGCIAFSPLAQGMLTSKYLDGIPEGSRAAQGTSLSPDLLTEQTLAHVRALNEMAAERGQSLAQMALAWALRDRRVTSVLIGASSVAQLDDSLGALDDLEFSADELDRDRPARGGRRDQPVGRARASPDRARTGRPHPRSCDRLPRRRRALGRRARTSGTASSVSRKQLKPVIRPPRSPAPAAPTACSRRLRVAAGTAPKAGRPLATSGTSSRALARGRPGRATTSRCPSVPCSHRSKGGMDSTASSCSSATSAPCRSARRPRRSGLSSSWCSSSIGVDRGGGVEVAARRAWRGPAAARC